MTEQQIHELLNHPMLPFTALAVGVLFGLIILHITDAVKAWKRRNH